MYFYSAIMEKLNSAFPYTDKCPVVVWITTRQNEDVPPPSTDPVPQAKSTVRRRNPHANKRTDTMSTAAIRAVTDARVQELKAAVADLTLAETSEFFMRLLSEDEEMNELKRRLRWPCSWQRLLPLEAYEFEAQITVTVEPLPPVPEEDEEEVDPEIEENTNPSLRIGNLCTASNRKKLMVSINEVFGKHGEIRDVNLPMDKATGNPRGFAFIEYRDPRDAMRAFKAESGSLKIGGRDIRVEMARSARKTTEEMAALHGPMKKKGADAATDA